MVGSSQGSMVGKYGREGGGEKSKRWQAMSSKTGKTRRLIAKNHSNLFTTIPCLFTHRCFKIQSTLHWRTIYEQLKHKTCTTGT
eukprot:5477358-Pleurochrysis_carterae.AAC.1